MNVFDFDKTIYSSDSTVDFYKYCLRKKPGLIVYFPFRVLGAVLYILRLCTMEKRKALYFSFLRGIKDVDQMTTEFVQSHIHKIAPWYLQMRRDDDVIISASPQFLVQKFSDAGLYVHVIATQVDAATGEVSGLNCYGAEKVKRLFAEYPEATVEAFYSDSPSDLPLAKLASQAFFVRQSKLSRWDTCSEA